MAYRLAILRGKELMHVHNIGWFYHDGKRWTEDDRGYARRAVLDTLRQALAESVGMDQAAREILRKDVRRCESKTGVEGVLSIASALSQFACTVDQLDPDPYLWNADDCTVDLRTNETRPHDPADRITKVSRAAYRTDSSDSEWDKFLDRVLPNLEVRGFLQRYLGSALCGRVLEHKLAIWTGEGRNGKGVLYGAVNFAMGDYGESAEPDLFMHKDNAHLTGEMDLLGKRFVVVSENDKNMRLGEAKVKRLTGGDKIKARRMRQDFVEFEPSHTPVLVTNYLPKVSGDDPASVGTAPGGSVRGCDS
jgi:putative DNA primase/helicase